MLKSIFAPKKKEIFYNRKKEIFLLLMTRHLENPSIVKFLQQFTFDHNQNYCLNIIDVR